MVALKKNVQRALKARGLTKAELGSRLGMTERKLEQILDDPPKRLEGLVGKLSRELVVPDFFLFADEDLIPDLRFPDFRLSEPQPGGYSRETIRWMDLACAIQSEATETLPTKRSGSAASAVPKGMPPRKAANVMREHLRITAEEQLDAKDARLFYALIRQRIESMNAFVLQLSFPDKDGAGFCLASPSYDVIVINTLKQNSARRLFTLAHELYHCVLGQTGVSDPFVVNNQIERRCNEFAAEFIAPSELVAGIAQRTISSSSLDIAELKRFSDTIKLSMYASVLRLVEVGIYKSNAVGAWQRFIAAHGNPEAARRQGGRRTDEWKYKLSKYGFKFAEVFGSAAGQRDYDAYELYRLSGIKPKYQAAYFANAAKATAADVEDDYGDEDD